MDEKSKEPITVLISAVGGQGGQLFAQWLFDAGRLAGYYPVGVGLPGLSQREGATVYYIEFFPDPEQTGLFSPFPEKGCVRLLIGLELLELVRILKEGYLSPDGFVFGSSHRVLTTEEKLPLYPRHLTEQTVNALMARFGDRGFLFNAVESALASGLGERSANALLLGALARSSVLPFPKEAFRSAIEAYGVSVSQNLKAFDWGYRYPEWLHRQEPFRSYLSLEWQSWSEPSLSEPLSKRLESFSRISQRLGSLVKEAVRMLVHYQNEPYAARYLTETETVLRREWDQWGQTDVTEEVARILALRMAYEDAIRVAQLKTERVRFDRLRLQHQIDPTTVYQVTDFLSPDWDELIGLLPASRRHRPVVYPQSFSDVELLLSAFPDQSAELQQPSLQLRLPTTSLAGYLLLRSLLLLKPLRTRSQRFAKEWALIDAWLTCVRHYLSKSPDWALVVAQSGELVRGYGRTRRKSEAAWKVFIGFVDALDRFGEREEKALATARRFLEIASEGPEGPVRAIQFVRDTLSLGTASEQKKVAQPGLRTVGEGDGK